MTLPDLREMLTAAFHDIEERRPSGAYPHLGQDNDIRHLASDIAWYVEDYINAAIERAADRVRALETHEGSAYEPGIEWLCVPTGLDYPPYAKDCGDDAAHYRLIDKDAATAAVYG